jgi:hypothetical protein
MAANQLTIIISQMNDDTNEALATLTSINNQQFLDLKQPIVKIISNQENQLIQDKLSVFGGVQATFTKIDSEANKYDAWQYGLDEIDSEYVIFLEAGELLGSTTILSQMVVQTQAGPDVVLGKVGYVMGSEVKAITYDHDSSAGRLYNVDYLRTHLIRWQSQLLATRTDAFFSHLATQLTDKIAYFDALMVVKNMPDDLSFSENAPEMATEFLVWLREIRRRKPEILAHELAFGLAKLQLANQLQPVSEWREMALSQRIREIFFENKDALDYTGTKFNREVSGLLAKPSDLAGASREIATAWYWQHLNYLGTDARYTQPEVGFPAPVVIGEVELSLVIDGRGLDANALQGLFTAIKAQQDVKLKAVEAVVVVKDFSVVRQAHNDAVSVTSVVGQDDELLTQLWQKGMRYAHGKRALLVKDPAIFSDQKMLAKILGQPRDQVTSIESAYRQSTGVASGLVVDLIYIRRRRIELRADLPVEVSLAYFFAILANLGVQKGALKAAVLMIVPKDQQFDWQNHVAWLSQVAEMFLQEMKQRKPRHGQAKLFFDFLTDFQRAK